MPLHIVYFSAELSGWVTMGTRPTLPINGVTLILANDLAMSKVMPDMQ